MPIERRIGKPLMPVLGGPLAGNCRRAHRIAVVEILEEIPAFVGQRLEPMTRRVAEGTDGQEPGGGSRPGHDHGVMQTDPCGHSLSQTFLHWRPSPFGYIKAMPFV